MWKPDQRQGERSNLVLWPPSSLLPSCPGARASPESLPRACPRRVQSGACVRTRLDHLSAALPAAPAFYSAWGLDSWMPHSGAASDRSYRASLPYQAVPSQWVLWWLCLWQGSLPYRAMTSGWAPALSWTALHGACKVPALRPPSGRSPNRCSTLSTTRSLPAHPGLPSYCPEWGAGAASGRPGKVSGPGFAWPFRLCPRQNSCTSSRGRGRLSCARS